MAVAAAVKRFERGSASAFSIEEVAREILAELDEPTSEASAAAERAGLRRADLVGARADVTEAEHGADPFLTPIIVGIVVAAGSKIAETLWTEVLWPRIRRRLGADALGGPLPPADES
ncbi:hypothetical protein ACU61A_21750 [Pseudonocardia sichuanensis]